MNESNSLYVAEEQVSFLRFIRRHSHVSFNFFAAPLAPPPPSCGALMNNGARDVSLAGGDVIRLQQQLQDIKEQVSTLAFLFLIHSSDRHLFP